MVLFPALLAAMASPGLPSAGVFQRKSLVPVLRPTSTTCETRPAQNAATSHKRLFVAGVLGPVLTSKTRIRVSNAREWTKGVTTGVLWARSSNSVSAVTADPEADVLSGSPVGSLSVHRTLEVVEGGRERRGAVRALELDSVVPSSSAMHPTAQLAARLLPLLSFLPLLLPGTALAAAAQSLSKGAAAKAVAGTGAPPLLLSDISSNAIFMSALVAWALAQSLKVFTTWWATKVLDWKQLFASGGMPSSHSAMCCGLTASVALLHGFAGPLFPICLAFTLIVMYDATSVRYHAGVQAKVLNVVVDEMLQGHPVSEKKLKEILGHTPLQVAGGATLGVVVALLYNKGVRWPA